MYSQPGIDLSFNQNTDYTEILIMLSRIKQNLMVNFTSSVLPPSFFHTRTIDILDVCLLYKKADFYGLFKILVLLLRNKCFTLIAKLKIKNKDLRFNRGHVLFNIINGFIRLESEKFFRTVLIVMIIASVN